MTKANRTGTWNENPASLAVAEKMARRIEARSDRYSCLVRDDMFSHTVFVSDKLSGSCVGHLAVYPNATGSANVHVYGPYLQWAKELAA